MSTYILNSLNNLKNKDIEAITNATTLNALLDYKDPNEMILSSLINNTISELDDKKHFYKTNISNIKIKNYGVLENISKEKEKEFQEIIKNNDVSAFFKEYKTILFEEIKNKSKDSALTTYELIGDYTTLINDISQRGLITPEYMDIMVKTTNELREINPKDVNVEIYLIKHIKEYLNTNNTTENKRILVNAHRKYFQPMNDGSKLADSMTPEDIVLGFYKEITWADGKSKLSPSTDMFKESFVSDGFSINSLRIGDSLSKFNSINNLKQLIKNMDNIEKYKLDDIKQFFEIHLLENNDLSEYLTKGENLNRIKNNEFLKDLNPEALLLTDSDMKKINTVTNIAHFNASVHDLYGTDININVSDLFYKKFGSELDSKESKKYTKELLDRYVHLKDQTKNKNNNILLYIALSSFDAKTKTYNQDLEDKYITLLTKPHNKYIKQEIELLNGIEDNWLKWAICHNREFKDNTITFTSVHPTTFNFGEFQLVKKEMGRDLTKEEIELVQASSLFPNLTFDIVQEFAPSNDKQRNILSNFLNNSEFNIKLDSISKTITKEEFYNTMNIYNVFNKNPKMLKEITGSGLDISSVLKSDKDSIQRVLSNLSSFNDKEISAIGKMLENPKVVPGNLSNLENYIKYYAKKMEEVTYKLYKKEKSTIPILDYKINKDYSMKSLTINEFAAIINGDVCNHCMSYGGASWGMIDYMFKKPENFLITQLEKGGVGIANSATWRVDNQLCFDSIEVVNNGQGVRESILMAYREHSLKILASDDTIDRITFGYSNHNNNVDFSKVGIKMSGTHPLISLPVNIYSDAKSNQSLIFTTNPHDLLVPSINEFMVNSLYEYSEYKDAKHDVIKSFLVRYSEQLDVVCEAMNNNKIIKMNNVDKLKELLHDYNVYNKTLKNTIKDPTIKGREEDI